MRDGITDSQFDVGVFEIINNANKPCKAHNYDGNFPKLDRMLIWTTPTAPFYHKYIVRSPQIKITQKCTSLQNL